MTDRQWQDLEHTIETMNSAEKLELIERVARALRRGNGVGRTRRPEDVARRLAELATLPLEGPDDGFSGADHDSALYDGSSATGFPEKPL